MVDWASRFRETPEGSDALARDLKKPIEHVLKRSFAEEFDKPNCIFKRLCKMLKLKLNKIDPYENLEVLILPV